MIEPGRGIFEEKLGGTKPVGRNCEIARFHIFALLSRHFYMSSFMFLPLPLFGCFVRERREGEGRGRGQKFSSFLPLYLSLVFTLHVLASRFWRSHGGERSYLAFTLNWLAECKRSELERPRPQGHRHPFQPTSFLCKAGPRRVASRTFCAVLAVVPLRVIFHWIIHVFWQNLESFQLHVWLPFAATLVLQGV